MAFGHFKDLAKRTASDKVSRNKSFNITKNPKDGGYQRGLQWFINCLRKNLQN